MALYLEFVVAGPPISNQQSSQQGRANLAAWRATIAGAAAQAWPNPPLTIELRAVIINFYAGNEPSLDTDNMSKPILDEMQEIATTTTGRSFRQSLHTRGWAQHTR